jgi:anti-anti-sigma factor
MALASPSCFRVETEVADRTALVSLFGELDLLAAKACEREVYHVGLCVQHVVVDLRGLTFIDRDGLFALIRAHMRSKLLDWKLTVVRGPPTVDEAFKPAFMKRLFDWVDRADTMFPPLPEPAV